MGHYDEFYAREASKSVAEKRARELDQGESLEKLLGDFERSVYQLGFYTDGKRSHGPLAEGIELMMKDFMLWKMRSEWFNKDAKEKVVDPLDS